MTQALNNVLEVGKIKALLNSSLINYDQAKILMQPILERMNQDGARIAKKYGRKHKQFTVSGLLR